MSTAVVAPVNPMLAESKDTVLQVMRRDRDNFTRLVSDPKNWLVETRCTGWQTRDLVGHMIDVMEGYFKNWDAALAGKDGTALGLPVMGETLNDHALEFRNLPREEALERFKADAMKLDKMLDELTPEEWTSFLVYHPFAGPVPAGFYGTFQIMDYGVHPYDIEYGLGNKLAEIDETTAGILIPYCHIIMQYTVDQDSAKGVDCTYGIDVSGPWGGKWRARVKDGQWQASPEDRNFEGCDALFTFDTPQEEVLTHFGRFPGGAAQGDPAVIEKVRHLFFPF